MSDEISTDKKENEPDIEMAATSCEILPTESESIGEPKESSNVESQMDESSVLKESLSQSSSITKLSQDEEQSQDFHLHLDSEEQEDFSLKLHLTEDSQSDEPSEMTEPKEITIKEAAKVTPMLNRFAKYLDVDKIMSTTPKLGNSFNGNRTLVLDDEEELTTPSGKKPESILIEKLLQHSAKKPREKANKVELSIISKELNKDGEEKLVSSNILVDGDCPVVRTWNNNFIIFFTEFFL